MSGSATNGNADFSDEDVLATERGDSIWRLYAEYGRTNWWHGAVGVLGTVVARILGLVPAFILGLALDAVVYYRRAYRLPFIPTDWIPTTQTGQLWLSVGLIVGSTVIAAGSTWVQNWGWNAFAQRVQHALRIGVMVLGISVIMASLNPQLALVALLLIRSSLGIMKPRVSIVLSETDYCSRI